MLVLGFATAAILRQFHDRVLASPMTTPVVGSLLFAAIVLLLLVTAREWRVGAVAGPGVRLGSITPLLLMLLIEKWIALYVFPPFIAWVSPRDVSDLLDDAVYRGLAGVVLIGTCLLVGRFSLPTMRKTLRRARPIRWPVAAIGIVIVVGACYLLIGTLSGLLGGELRLDFPRSEPLLYWVLGGQAVLAFAEELYYRGLLMSEMERLAPRLGMRKPAARRWTALLFTAGLFGLEHLTLQESWSASLRELVFAVSLGVLFGILVMVSTNLHFAAGTHAWINWLLLGAVPYYVDSASIRRGSRLYPRRRTSA